MKEKEILLSCLDIFHPNGLKAAYDCNFIRTYMLLLGVRQLC